MDLKTYEIVSKAEKHHWWFNGRRLIISNIIEKYKSNENEKILDVGCGTGGNLTFLKQFGNVTSLEMSEEAISYFRLTNPHETVYQGYLPNSFPKELKKEKFTFITMFDVLEHIEEESESLQVIKNKLAKDGVLLCTVPAYQCLWSKSDEKLWHKRRYTKKQLCSVLEENGFKIEYSTYFNTFLFPIAAIVRILSKYNNNYNQDDELKISIVNPILKWIFQLESILIPKLSLSYGLTVCVVAKIK